MKKPDYDHLSNLITDISHQILLDNGRYGNTATRYTDLIAFLENEYCASVVALVSALLLMAKNSADPEKTLHHMAHARRLMETPEISVKERLTEQYKHMITGLNLPDPFAQKSHNEQVADDIKQELDQPDG